ncbi:hypothetical protein [Turicibacter sp. T129]|uniref:hypothetical protein n=1 Tax=Turicibacter sp. T129 TaxID=2951141 RepID=UPI0021D4EC0A|nr:hypothetical protein [Turicibacter sp. T129]MCU7193169.1 hypothetical protein [Turicibacter sp. T129]
MNAMTLEEKSNIVSKLLVAMDIIPQNQQDQLSGIIIGYSMASELMVKGAGDNA